MSEPAAFAIVRDGQQRYYADRWASVYFIRELAWGPEAFETWVTQLEEIDEWYGDFNSAALVDFDQRRLMWTHGDERLNVPKVAALYQRLLSAAWPGYHIEWTVGDAALSAALGIPKQSGDDEDQDGQLEPYDSQEDLENESNDPNLGYRPRTVGEACGRYSDEDEDGEEDDQPDSVPKLGGPTAQASAQEHSETLDPPQLEFGDQELRAWVTIADASGAVRHRQLQCLPQDLLQGAPAALAELSNLAPSEVPREELVSEGMWIEQAERTIGFWGSPRLQALLPVIEKGWAGWDVQWAPRGYAQHCSATGPAGQPLSIEAGLAKLLPVILSTERFNISTVVGAIGGSLKKTAIKGTGCLLLVVCSPLLIFGAVSGNWQAVLITVGVVIALAVIVFKAVEMRIKRSFKDKFVDREEAGRSAPATAGPLEPAARRQALEKILAAGGLPSLVKVEPLFPPKNELNLP